jgi:hypothetical protein
MLLNQVQKQQHEIEEQQQVIAELASRLARLEGADGVAAATEGGIR